MSLWASKRFSRSTFVSMMLLRIVGRHVKDGVSLDQVLRGLLFSLCMFVYVAMSCETDNVDVRLGPPTQVPTDEGWSISASV